MCDNINLTKSDIICDNILTEIVEKGKNRIDDKRIIKKFLVPHAVISTNFLTKGSIQMYPKYDYICNKTQKS